ncbi:MULTISPECIES: carboxymuconolactone decarboxylase family protein [Burkholderia]|uniref:carboxymuconolactone decarboxylase family protein n=1 Tax=Burkholderia TaxID=32008 RepID=UPI00067894E0|nr:MULTISPECIES: carboxymuconolactone decarboxylase family protein [Burkholderia]KWU16790.1 alkylhydroperoxidase [Burkholderia cenocepacia]OXI71762.1 carboxymuconolactone decarboxylase family protein [Burkholderia sp. AU31280]QRR16031.1 carboxymuconolactone decarboxylase family protein [Burkholderia sp. MS389]CAG2332071.1 putative carboxymuconolactone decarboxylase family protein [Burkholderia cenocepacia]CAG2332188.1 putative carboxymuconolactone decarboxylase family protein [Burkholderia cen
MTRLTTLKPSEATGETAAVFGQIKAALGKVPNAYATIGTHSPAGLAAMLNVDAAIAASSLDQADVEAVRLAVSALSGCDYCLAAHTMLGKMSGLTPEVMKNIRAGRASGDARRDALLSFVRSIATTRDTVPADVLQAVLAAGYTERQVIEIILVMTSILFTNLVNRVNDTTLDFPAVD